MSLGTLPLVNIVADVVLLLSALALAVIMAWQNPRHHGRAFAVCLLIFGLYALGDLLWKLARPLGYAPRPPLEAATVFYEIGILLLTLLAFAYGQLPIRLRRLLVVFCLPVGAVFLGVSVSGLLYRDFRPLSGGTYGHSLTETGQLGALTAMAYLGVVSYLLWRHGSLRSRALVLPMGILTGGIALHSVAIPLHVYAFNVLAVTVAIILIGRTLIRFEVFKPLADLNAELTVKNTELQEAARLKSQFLANMTHELRTPLNSIIGYTDMINTGAYGTLNEQQADRMRRVNRNGLRLLELINAVLDLSKIEAGRLELARGRVAISSLVEAACVEIEPRASAKGLRLVRQVPHDLPAVWADEVRVFQILEKLLANAVNFTDAGEITVSGALDRARNEVVLSVADTGSGVEPSQRAHIFEAFIPGNARLVNPHKGPGLGLAIAYRLAALHGGRLWYDTVLGAGSTFYVALPAVADKNATAEHTPVWREARRA